MFGHIAGTPTISEGLAVAPIPLLGEVVALTANTGVVQWRKKVSPARGSVTIVGRKVFFATTHKSYAVLDMHTGQSLCEAPLPQTLDRAALTVLGETGVLVFSDGMIRAAPVREWMECLVDFPR